MKRIILFLSLCVNFVATHANADFSTETNLGFSVYSTTTLKSHSELDTSNNMQQHSQEHSEKSINKEEVGLDEFDNLHPLVVHFPIVLLLFAALLQLIQLFVLKRNLDWVILLLIGTGFIGAYVAGTFVHPHTHGLTDIAQKVLENHDKYADWTVWSSALAAVLKIISLFWVKLNRGFEIAVFLVMAFAAFSVSQAGHYGAQLVYIQGVGPQGQFLESEDAGEETHSH